MTDSQERFELWFRLVYKPLLEAQKMTAALRPGNRQYPHPKGTFAGQDARIVILKTPGDDNGRKAILDSIGRNIEITEVRTKKIGDLTAEDFTGMSPDCQSVEAAKYHLGLIYNILFSDENEVSIIRWRYQ